MIDPALLEELRRFVNASRLPEWQRDLVETVPDHLVRQIAEDFRKGPPPAGPTLPSVKVMGAGTVVDGETAARTRGWVDAPKVNDWTPPGLREMDAMMDEADRRDRAERIRELAGTQHALNLAKAAAEAEARASEEELNKKGKGGTKA
jgi:hypothetical protein